MKATTLLERQHRKVESLFKKLESGRSDPGPVMTELANDLCAHMKIEQEIFYPSVRSIDAELVVESYEEHAMAEIGLKRLLATDPSDPTFHAKVKTLEELIEHHIEEEEEELLPKVESKLGDEQLETLGKQMKTEFTAAVEEGYEALLPRGTRTTADATVSRRAPARNGAAVR